MSEELSVSERIDQIAFKLADLSRAVYQAYDVLEEAEGDWLPKFDAVAEALREEGREQGRKSDPAEHTVLAAARHRYPAEYGAWKNAKREVQRLETISQNRRAEMSGLQSELKAAA